MAVLPIQPSSVTESTIGFNVGGDAGYYFTRAIGVGVVARYARGVVSVPIRGNTVTTQAGGFQVTAGLRLRLPRTSGKKTPGKPPTKPVRPGPVKKGPGK